MVCYIHSVISRYYRNTDIQIWLTASPSIVNLCLSYVTYIILTEIVTLIVMVTQLTKL